MSLSGLHPLTHLMQVYDVRANGRDNTMHALLLMSNMTMIVLFGLYPMSRKPDVAGLFETYCIGLVEAALLAFQYFEKGTSFRLLLALQAPSAPNKAKTIAPAGTDHAQGNLLPLVGPSYSLVIIL